jgi:hypothetical protein
VREAFFKVGLAVVPPNAVFLSDSNVDSQATCEAQVEIHKLVNTTVELTLRDYLTRDVIWSSSETAYLDDSIKFPLQEVMGHLERDRQQANWRKAAFEQRALHYPDSSGDRLAAEKQRANDLAFIAAESLKRLSKDERQQVERSLTVIQLAESSFDRVSALRTIQNMGDQAILSGLVVLVDLLLKSEEVDMTIGILDSLLKVADHLPGSLTSIIEDCYRDPDEEVKLAAKKVLQRLRAKGAE